MDSKYLIACHCFSHQELFLFKFGKDPISLKSDGLKNNVEYIDPSCKNVVNGEVVAASSVGTLTDWKAIPASSKDYIFAINCPLKHPATGPLVRRNLFIDGWNILKPGGKIFIEMSDHWIPDMVRLLPQLYKGKYTVEQSTFENLPIAITNIKPQGTPYRSSIIMTKIVSAGKRKKTYRSRKNKKTTRKHR